MKIVARRREVLFSVTGLGTMRAATQLPRIEFIGRNPTEHAKPLKSNGAGWG